MGRVREVLADDDERQHYAFDVNAQDVIAFDPELGYLVLQHPVLLLPIFEEAVIRCQLEVVAAANRAPPHAHEVSRLDAYECGVHLRGGCRIRVEVGPAVPDQVPSFFQAPRTRPTLSFWEFQPGGLLKSHVHVRISHLPPVPELYKTNVSSIRSSDVGRLIQVAGTGQPKVRLLLGAPTADSYTRRRDCPAAFISPRG